MTFCGCSLLSTRRAFTFHKKNGLPPFQSIFSHIFFLSSFQQRLLIPLYMLVCKEPWWVQGQDFRKDFSRLFVKTVDVRVQGSQKGLASRGVLGVIHHGPSVKHHIFSYRSQSSKTINLFDDFFYHVYISVMRYTHRYEMFCSLYLLFTVKLHLMHQFTSSCPPPPRPLSMYSNTRFNKFPPLSSYRNFSGIENSCV